MSILIWVVSGLVFTVMVALSVGIICCAEESSETERGAA